MTQDIVLNTFALNGTTIAQPTDHHWVDREQIGVDGNGVAIFPSVRQYEIKWDFLSDDEFNQLYSFYLVQGVTGTIVSSLPTFDATPYSFYAYSGTVLREPTFDNFFQNYYSNVRLLIVRITT